MCMYSKLLLNLPNNKKVLILETCSQITKSMLASQAAEFEVIRDAARNNTICNLQHNYNHICTSSRYTKKWLI